MKIQQDCCLPLSIKLETLRSVQEKKRNEKHLWNLKSALTQYEIIHLERMNIKFGHFFGASNF